MKHNIRIIQLAILLLSANVSAQLDSFTWLDDEAGLPQNSIKSIVPDKYGFLWLTTENGLVRYDGQEFKTFNSENQNFSNNRFLYIAGKKEIDSLFTNTDGQNDIILIHKGQPKRFNKKHAYKTPIYVDGLFGEFYAQCIPNVYLDYGARPVRYFRSDGKYFLLLNKRISFHTKYGKKLWEKPFEYTDTNSVFMLGNTLGYIDPKGVYWECTEKGISQSNELIGKLPKERSYFWNASNDQVFIISNVEIYQLKKIKSGSLNLKKLYHGSKLDPSNLSSFYYDEANSILFAGSATDGLGKFEVKRFKTYKPDVLLSTRSQVFYSVNELEPNVVLTAAGYVIKNGKMEKKYNFTRDRSKLIIDKEKNVWVTGYTSIFCFTSKSNYTEKIKVLHTDDDCSALFYDNNDAFFAAVNDRYSNTSSLFIKTKENGFKFEEIAKIPAKVNQIRSLNSESLLLCTAVGLFKYFKATKKIVKFEATKNLAVRNAVILNENEIWFFSYGKGFRLLKDNKIFKFPLDDNQSLLTAHTVVPDKLGNFWIPTNKGLFRVKRNDLLNYANGHTKKVNYFLFKKDSGFYSNEFNGGGFPNSLITQDGNIWLPSLNGVVCFNPEQLQPKSYAENIYVEEAIVDDQTIDIRSNPMLPRNFERVVIKIVAPYYGIRENLILEAKLFDGENSSWTRVDESGKIAYTKLAPGKHKLVVRKRIASENDYKYLTVDFCVKQAYYDTGLFKVLMVLVVLSLLFGIYVVRIFYVNKRNELLELKIAEKTSKLQDIITTLRETTNRLNAQTTGNRKIIQYITHDLKSPLRFMAMLSRDLIEDQNKNEEQLSESFLAIYQSSNQMYVFVENLLDYSKLNLSQLEKRERTWVYDIVISKINLFRPIAMNQKTKIFNQIPSDFTISGNPVLLRIIVHNLLDNALKYSAGKTIIFSASEHETHKVIAVIDTGVGMNTETLEYYKSLSRDFNNRTDNVGTGLGLKIVIELMVVLGAKIEFNSSSNGTVVSLVFEK